MKNTLINLLLFFTSFYCFSNELTDYEHHYQNINKLKSELEVLELKKKIQQVEVEIYESKQSLNLITNPAKIASKEENAMQLNKFNPNMASLLYIVGTGIKTYAVISFNQKMISLKNGTIYQGWKIKIANKNVTLTKGLDVVKL